MGNNKKIKIEVVAKSHEELIQEQCDQESNSNTVSIGDKAFKNTADWKAYFSKKILQDLKNKAKPMVTQVFAHETYHNQPNVIQYKSNLGAEIKNIKYTDKATGRSALYSIAVFKGLNAIHKDFTEELKEEFKPLSGTYVPFIGSYINQFYLNFALGKRLFRMSFEASEPKVVKFREFKSATEYVFHDDQDVSDLQEQWSRLSRSIVALDQFNKGNEVSNFFTRALFLKSYFKYSADPFFATSKLGGPYPTFPCNVPGHTLMHDMKGKSPKTKAKEEPQVETNRIKRKEYNTDFDLDDGIDDNMGNESPTPSGKKATTTINKYSEIKITEKQNLTDEENADIFLTISKLKGTIFRDAAYLKQIERRNVKLELKGRIWTIEHNMGYYTILTPDNNAFRMDSQPANWGSAIIELHYLVYNGFLLSEPN